MSDQQNLTTVKRFYELANETMQNGSTDPKNISALMTDDMEWVTPPPESNFRGRDAVGQFMSFLLTTLEFEVFQPDEFIVATDCVVVLGHERCRVRSTGRIVEAKWAQIHNLRDRRICRFREYSDTDAWKLATAEMQAAQTT